MRQEPRIRFLTIDMDCTNLRRNLDENLQTILSSIHKEFTSKEFIDVYHRTSPNSYAEGVRGFGDFRRLHAWIARWYLLEKVKAGILRLQTNPHDDKKWRRV